MGLFDKIFGNKNNESINANSTVKTKEFESSSSDKWAKISDENKAIYRNLDKNAIHARFESLKINSEKYSLVNLETFQNLKSNLNYPENIILQIELFLRKVHIYSEGDNLENLKNQIEYYSKELATNRESSNREKNIALKNIEFLTDLLNKPILFCLYTELNINDIFFYYEENSIKYVDCRGLWQVITPYDLFDIYIVFDFFSSHYKLDYLRKNNQAISLERHSKLFNAPGEYFEEIYSLLTNSIETDSFEYGFYYSNNSLFSIKVTRFLFISNFFDFILPIFIENAKRSLKKFDPIENGKLKIIDNDFERLIQKYQKEIIELDTKYIHQFVKVSSHLNKIKTNVETIFQSIDFSKINEVNYKINLLISHNFNYETLLFHSINMLESLRKGELITFYEIYEAFDKLGIYNNNWENDMIDNFKIIGNKLDDLIVSVAVLEQNIINQLAELSYVTQESFKDLNYSVNNQLKNIESSINTNVLFAGIQAYQLHKIKNKISK